MDPTGMTLSAIVAEQSRIDARRTELQAELQRRIAAAALCAPWLEQAVAEKTERRRKKRSAA